MLSTAPDPPAQLMELRESEAFGVLDHHDRRLGYVDADLDHSGGVGNPEIAGTRRAFNKRFLLALAEHFEREGAKVIAKVAKDQPAAYMKILRQEIPRVQS